MAAKFPIEIAAWGRRVRAVYNSSQQVPEQGCSRTLQSREEHDGFGRLGFEDGKPGREILGVIRAPARQ